MTIGGPTSPSIFLLASFANFFLDKKCPFVKEKCTKRAGGFGREASHFFFLYVEIFLTQFFLCLFIKQKIEKQRKKTKKIK